MARFPTYRRPKRRRDDGDTSEPTNVGPAAHATSSPEVPTWDVLPQPEDKQVAEQAGKAAGNPATTGSQRAKGSTGAKALPKATSAGSAATNPPSVASTSTTTTSGGTTTTTRRSRKGRQVTTTTTSTSTRRSRRGRTVTATASSSTTSSAPRRGGAGVAAWAMAVVAVTGAAVWGIQNAGPSDDDILKSLPPVVTSVHHGTHLQLTLDPALSEADALAVATRAQEVNRRKHRLDLVVNRSEYQRPLLGTPDDIGRLVLLMARAPQVRANLSSSDGTRASLSLRCARDVGQPCVDDVLPFLRQVVPLTSWSTISSYGAPDLDVNHNPDARLPTLLDMIDALPTRPRDVGLRLYSSSARVELWMPTEADIEPARQAVIPTVRGMDSAELTVGVQGPNDHELGVQGLGPSAPALEMAHAASAHGVVPTVVTTDRTELKGRVTDPALVPGLVDLVARYPEWEQLTLARPKERSWRNLFSGPVLRYREDAADLLQLERLGLQPAESVYSSSTPRIDLEVGSESPCAAPAGSCDDVIDALDAFLARYPKVTVEAGRAEVELTRGDVKASQPGRWVKELVTRWNERH